ncbi:MAG: nitroreductase [Alphaproteobacteria bacterium]|nr:nitroreductase [Alphaproteobacteria bacterium]MDE2112530.1 nitroreductase [Alphaproteobacteria bacterium]MDE2492922.1 nitroreductase [Alphaproteobacteria bacterium]
MHVAEAIASRKSIRAFKPDPVPRVVVEDILTRAARAPSGGNLQPWRVYALLGAARDELVRRVTEARRQHPMGESPEYLVYPPNLAEPWRTRRFRIGEAMYEALGIPRGDMSARLAHITRNWQFFDAPVGLMFTIDRCMQQGQWADLGMFLQNVMLLARAHGLHTCAIEAWAMWHRQVREYLSIPDSEMLFCGMALGHADEAAPVNALVSERAPLEEFAVIRESL